MRIALAIALVCLALPVLAADTPTTQPGEAAGAKADAAPITYKGRRVAREQAREWFEKLGKNFVEIDGKVVDVGRWLLDPSVVQKNDPQAGTLAITSTHEGCRKTTITDVDAGSKCLLVTVGDVSRETVDRKSLHSPRDMTIRILVKDIAKYKKGDVYNSNIVFVRSESLDSGPFKNAPQVWMEYAPITENRFYLALSDGLSLVNRKIVIDDPPQERAEREKQNAIIRAQAEAAKKQKVILSAKPVEERAGFRWKYKIEETPIR